MARPRTQLLSREIILDAALDLINTHQDFTIAGIGKHLGVNPSSLYHHISGGRTEIVNALRERIYRRIDLPSLLAQGQPWQVKLANWVRAYREAVACFPSAIPLLIGRTVDDAPTLALYETLACILTEADVSPDHHVDIISMLDALVFGSAIDVGSPNPLWTPGPQDHPALHRALTTGSPADRVARGLEIGIQATIAVIEKLAADPAELGVVKCHAEQRPSSSDPSTSGSNIAS